MDSAFQELDYSDISAKNINKKPQPGLINTKTRGGLVRLIIVVVFGIIIGCLGITIYSRYSQMKTLNKEYDKVAATHQSTLHEKEAVKVELEKLKKENANLNTQIEQAKANNETLTNDIIKYTEENNKMQTELTSIEKDLTDLNSEINQLTQQNELLKTKIADITAENKELEEKIKQLKQK